MTELEIIQPKEQFEGGEAIESVEEQALRDATHDPGARVEQTQDFEQAEALESALAEAIDNGAQVELSPLPIPNPEPAFEDPGPGGRPGGDVAATPINLPLVADDGTELMDNPADSGDQIAKTPETVPDPPPPGDVMQGYGSRVGEVSATPINVPLVADDVVEGGEGDRPGDEVSATPINVPSPVENQVEVGAGAQVAEIPDTGGDPPGPNRGRQFEEGKDVEGDPVIVGGEKGAMGLDQKPGAVIDEEGSQASRLIHRRLPQQGKVGAGMDKQGNIMEGRLPGGGVGSSKGFPGHSPGGSKGKGGWKEGDGHQSGNSYLGRWLDMKSIDNGTPGRVDEPDGQGFWVLGKDGDWHYQVIDDEPTPTEGTSPGGDPIDGDTPMPYTGMSGGEGVPTNPEFSSGKLGAGGTKDDSGHLVGVHGSGGKSGGKTPGDKDGDDDSGHFMGDPNLSSPYDDYVSPDGGDIPYHDLNQDDIKNK